MNDPELQSETSSRESLRLLLTKRAAGDKVSNNSSPETPHSVSGSLVPIRSGTPEKMLLFVIGGGAGIVSYRRLAEQLSTNGSIAASQLQGLKPQSPESRSIDKLAEAHLKGVLTESRAETFAIVGHSLAGNVALELARKLEGYGKKIDFVCVVDQAAPNSRVTWREWLFWQRAAIAQLAPRQRWHYIRDGIRFRLTSHRRVPRWLKRWLAGGNKAGQKFDSKERLTANEYRLGMMDATIIALREHRPEPVRFPFVLVRAKSGSPRIQADRHGGWGDVASGTIAVIDIPGHHMNIFDEDHVQFLADELNNVSTKLNFQAAAAQG